MEDHRKFIISRFLQIMGLPMMLLFFLRHAWLGNWREAAINLGLAVLTGGLVLAERLGGEPWVKYQRRQLVLWLFVVAFGAHILYTVGVAGEQSRLLWALPFPILIFFALGARSGTFWALAFGVGVGVLLYEPPVTITLTGDDAAMRLRFLLALGLMSAAAVTVEHVARRDRMRLVREKMALEESLDRLKREIQNREEAERRNRDLAARIRQSQKMEAVGALAGGVAHDFNTILAAMVGYTELARRGLPPGHTAQGHLNQVLKAGQRAGQLVRQLLDFSRREEPDLTPLELGPVVEEALDLLRATLPDNVELRPDLASPGVVVGDSTRLHQVVMNLGANAIQAMSPGGGVLEVGLAEVELEGPLAAAGMDLPPGSYLRLTVADSGSGMSPEVMERIFEPYFTTKEPGQGTGIGLAVVHGIVLGCGGGISVESRQGKGTRFQVYLPRAAQEAPGDEAPAAEDLPTGSEHILLVDDEPTMLELQSQALELLGYRVTGRTSSLEALGLFRADPQRFDLMLSDLAMPKLSGDLLAREVLSIRPDMPILITTGFSGRLTEERVRHLGVREVLKKPLVLADLAHAIRRALGEAPPGRAESGGGAA